MDGNIFNSGTKYMSGVCTFYITRTMRCDLQWDIFKTRYGCFKALSSKDTICISHGFPGEMEFSPTSSPYPAQSRVAARAGFGDEWEKTHLSWKTMWNAFSPMLHHLCCQNKPICNNNKLTAAAILNILVPIRRDGNISHLFISLATQRSMREKFENICLSRE